MKIRYDVRCERCKRWMGTGTPRRYGVRMYGRIWCFDCVREYSAARRERREATR